jgi:hypothetical protein
MRTLQRNEQALVEKNPCGSCSANLRDTALCVISFMSTMSPIHAQRSITYSLLPRDELLIPKVIDRPPR